MIKEQKIRLATAKAKNKAPVLKICETPWDRLFSCKYQSLVPRIDQFTIKRRTLLLKHTNSKMIRKIFKSGHNVLPAHKSKYDLATPFKLCSMWDTFQWRSSLIWMYKPSVFTEQEQRSLTLFPFTIIIPQGSAWNFFWVMEILSLRQLWK